MTSEWGKRAVWGLMMSSTTRVGEKPCFFQQRNQFFLEKVFKTNQGFWLGFQRKKNSPNYSQKKSRRLRRQVTCQIPHWNFLKISCFQKKGGKKVQKEHAQKTSGQFVLDIMKHQTALFPQPLVMDKVCVQRCAAQSWKHLIVTRARCSNTSSSWLLTSISFGPGAPRASFYVKPNQNEQLGLFNMPTHNWNFFRKRNVFFKNIFKRQQVAAFLKKTFFFKMLANEGDWRLSWRAGMIFWEVGVRQVFFDLVEPNH